LFAKRLEEKYGITVYAYEIINDFLAKVLLQQDFLQEEILRHRLAARILEMRFWSVSAC
jgi:hypothetical protein